MLPSTGSFTVFGILLVLQLDLLMILDGFHHIAPEVARYVEVARRVVRNTAKPRIESQNMTAAPTPRTTKSDLKALIDVD